ncbi:MAG: hypothetical protein ACI4SO_07615 [Muribaculaceae bacterium]
MKIVEKDSEKRALIWVIKKASTNCLDCSVVLKDNKQDAVNYYEQERDMLSKYASSHGYILEDSPCPNDNSNWCDVINEKGDEVKFLAINLRCMVITDKSN